MYHHHHHYSGHGKNWKCSGDVRDYLCTFYRPHTELANCQARNNLTCARVINYLASSIPDTIRNPFIGKYSEDLWFVGSKSGGPVSLT